MGMQREMQVIAEPALRKGVYSNLVVVSHQKEEFVLDFLFVDPRAQGPKGGQALLVARVILSPGHMKRLHQAIGENIEKYEKNFGKIIVPPKLQ
ncbi:DUF3467 domain-containing protein [Candidatus Bipolaricaulota bacterium]|nr:DUF3467 domain-containing protein [Candidatus Bipolaricaulota bacterium]